MKMDDLRDFLDMLEEFEEVQRIKVQVDWNLEMGAITRRCYDLARRRRCSRISRDIRRDSERWAHRWAQARNEGIRYLPALHWPSAYDQVRRQKKSCRPICERRENLIKPIVVSTGPCKENIMKGADVDVLKFPIPLIHGGDGGRYIGTWHTVITKDPDSSWVNWGMYRLMVHDRNTLGCLFPLQQHIGQMYQKYEAMNRSMPIAVAIGGQPVIPIVSCVQLPAHVNEVDVAGGLQNAPISLVRCETVDLDVPATLRSSLKEKYCHTSVWSKDLLASTWAMKRANLHRSRS